MKKLLIFIVIFIMVILIFLTTSCIKEKYTFEKGFKEILTLDKKYNGSFYDEAIDPGNLYNSSLFLPVQGRILVPLENIDAFIKELDSINAKISQMEINNHTTALLKFIDLRKKMLEMQKYYHMGEAQKQYLIAGPKRSQIISTRAFGCKEGPQIIETALYYNNSAKLGRAAVDILDDLLNQFQDNPDIPEIIQIDNKRPKFIDGPFWPMINVMNDNANRVKKLCSLKESITNANNANINTTT